MNPWLTARLRHAPVALALIIVTLLHSLLAEQLTLTGLIEIATGTEFFDSDANDWLYYAEWCVIAVFVVLWALGRESAMRRIIMGFSAYVTLTLGASVLGLVFTLTVRKTPEAGFDLLWDAFWVWTINVLIFAVWYWLLDGHATRRRHFLFPQQSNALPGWESWNPSWFDYLFLAFTHSTAFSPTDTASLSRRAKFLIMLQASMSLVTLAMIAARAINIIG